MVGEFKNNDTQSVNAWFDNCKNKGIPSVIVRHRNKYSKVEWDCITLKKNSDQKIDGNEENLSKQISEIFNRYSNEKATYHFTVFYGWFDNMLPEHACMAAEEIFEVIDRTVTP